MTKTNQSLASMDNIYTLDGKVPLLKSIPFGLQHVLAMFVANIAPIMIVTGACGLSTQETASLIQTAMIMAGLGTFVQLFTVWKLGAKLPIVALIASALFDGAWWVAPSAYFLGIGAIIISGIMLKKTKLFAGDPAPFVMELPAYHWPTAKNMFHSVWERGWSFVKKAGTVILLSSIIIWAGSVFGIVEGSIAFDPEMDISNSFLGIIGNSIKWIFIPLGFGSIKAAVATVMGLVAKEEIVAVFGVLDFEGMSALAGYSFLAFNLLCAPCFAAMGAIRREMNSAKWTAFAICYQCILAYAVSLMIFQFGSAFSGNINIIGTIAAALVLAFILFMLFRPYKEATKLTKDVKIK